jgi:GNAT superfamily N-acetyltransferase
VGEALEIRAFDKFHDCNGFQCGVERIDNYLTKTAWREHKAFKIRVFAATKPDEPRVLGYYSLTFIVWTDDGVAESVKPKFVKSGEAVPALYLAKLGVVTDAVRQGIGTSLVRDAFARSLAVAENAGILTLTLDAINEDKARWYGDLGFDRFAEEDLRMVISLHKLRKAL